MLRRQGKQPKQPKPVISRTVSEQRAHLAREIVETLLFVGLVFVIINLAVKAYRVANNKMAPQLQQGQSVLVNKAAYLFGGPSRGDVVVFISPCSGDSNNPFIGRVVAVPGDVVTINATSVKINGVTLNEPYVHVADGSPENNIVVSNLKLGDNQYYVLDDNRTVSGGDPANCSADSDSRGFGTVPRQNIQGKAVLVFWPLSDREWVSNYSDVFSGVNK